MSGDSGNSVARRVSSPIDWRVRPTHNRGGYEMEHKALVDPETKDDWHAYVMNSDPEPVEVLNRAQLDRLTWDERREYDFLRDRQHGALSIVQTDDLVGFRAELARMLRLNWSAPSGARAGLALSGPPRAGKSTVLKVVAREFEHYLRAHAPEYFEREGDLYVPVAYVSVKANGTVKGLLRSLAKYYDVPPNQSAPTDVLFDQVVHIMRRCHTHLLILDEIQKINVLDPVGQRTNDLLKTLGNSLPTTIVVGGVNLREAKFFTEGRGELVTQTSGRFKLLEMSWFDADIDTADGWSRWVSTINTLEESLVLAEHPRFSLGDQAGYLLERTGGCIWSLALLIRDAADVAVTDGIERIDRQVLDSIRTDYATMARYLALTQGETRGEPAMFELLAAAPHKA